MCRMGFDGVRQDEREAQRGLWEWVGLIGLALLAAGVLVLITFALQVA